MCAFLTGGVRTSDSLRWRESKVEGLGGMGKVLDGMEESKVEGMGGRGTLNVASCCFMVGSSVSGMEIVDRCDLKTDLRGTDGAVEGNEPEIVDIL